MEPSPELGGVASVTQHPRPLRLLRGLLLCYLSSPLSPNAEVSNLLKEAFAGYTSRYPSPTVTRPSFPIFVTPPLCLHRYVLIFENQTHFYLLKFNFNICEIECVMHYLFFFSIHIRIDTSLTADIPSR